MKICKARWQHTYDEYGLCFECDKPQSKAAMMRRKRAEYTDAGMVRAEFWLTPEQKQKVSAYVERIKRA